MASLTIRNLPNEVVARLKEVAAKRERSMEQEVRELLLERYTSKKQVLGRVREDWAKLPKSTAKEVEGWLRQSRKRGAASGI
jgi:hypothetical protein